MNKKLLKIALLVLVFGVLSLLVYKVVSKTKEKEIAVEKLETIPEFELMTLKEKPFTNLDLKANLYTIFVYFNSECDFCQHEAESISENLSKFVDVHFVFVSKEPIEKIKEFSQQYQLNDKSDIVFLHDNTSIFSTQFDATSIPYVLIYDKNQNLIEKRKGQLNASGILRILNQN